MAGTRTRSMEEDDEDYWMSSSMKNKASIFDDNDDAEGIMLLGVSRNKVKDLSKTMKEGLGEMGNTEEDIINWDGSSTSSGSSLTSDLKSVRYRSSPTSHLAPRKVTSNSASRSSSNSSLSGQSRVSNVGVTVPKPSPDSLTSSISDAVQGAKRVPSLTDVSKIEAEVQFLRRQLNLARRDRWEKLPVRETVKRIILGEPYSLEAYKSKEDKLSLLDTATAMHDGNAIMAAVLFLKSTVKAQIFHHEMMRRPVATNHYLIYLKSSREYNQLADILGLFGRSEEAAMLKYKQAVSPVEQQVKIRNLKQCLGAHFSMDPSLAYNTSMVLQQLSLLETQLPINEYDAQLEREGKTAIFKEFPRTRPLLGVPVLATLYYCCFYHYGLPENNLACPAALRKKYNLTSKQYLWVALSARSSIRHWRDIDELFASKSWFGHHKMKSPVSFDRVVDVLFRTGAPPEVIDKYLRLVDGIEQRLTIARKLKCHVVVIDALVELRDRQELLNYASKLQEGTNDAMHAQVALRNPATRWKN
ncbi:PREDICTED: spermatogenesis-defective protein 39 homolog [Priapulus caudatus]|uniref:Spermatogenesis-defective protein 39 homolog n=1 Tax=Priapulus caudatus TaxID=37621 RepID=A0ABM1ENR5_PRICU|nr:PREDICTED: spermatogenesis-defective protein 39 homolog [Priapulus caudatus]XP_014673836.1 PREDICTED: spermatogenesis-defective protein 39 homolog [Priapulus caudatus]